MDELGIATTMPTRKDRRFRLDSDFYLPRLTDAARSFLTEDLHIEHGEMWYRVLSGVAHSVYYASVNHISAGPETSGGKVQPQADLSLVVVGRTVMIAVDSYLFTVQRHAELWGRDSETILAKRIESRNALLAPLYEGTPT
jgi:hypothetical protein